jgi:hypothetical protein
MCRGYFSSQEIDSHHASEHRSTDQSRNGCRMCWVCHAQPFEITRAKKIKCTAEQHSCQNAKVVEAFCHAACRLSNQCRPSIHQPPVDEFRMPAEMSIALSWAHLHAHMHVASCPTSRDFLPWRFSDAGRRSAWRDHHSGGRKPAKKPEVRQAYSITSSPRASTLAEMVIRAARLAAILPRIARGLRHADRGPAVFETGNT